VYFKVTSFPAYGTLSGNTLEKLQSGAGGRVQDEHQGQKQHPADFLLWKEDPRHIMKWPSPVDGWGEGYPGWHIECSVMSAARLAPGVTHLAGSSALIDLHSGGEDNIFPHHECEIAQTCCAFNEKPEGATYARMWFHPRFLMVNGEKMSKSKGNFFTARDLFAKGHEAGPLRLALISTHYRSNANFTEQLIKDAARMIERWRRIADAGASGSAPSNPGGQGARDAAMLGFANALHEDLNIAGAIAEVNTWANGCEKAGSEDAALMKVFDDVLGVLSLERAATTSNAIGLFLPGVTPSDEVQAILEERRAARAAKDFKKSDEIRDRLLKMGYTIKDVAGGKVEVGRA